MDKFVKISCSGAISLPLNQLVIVQGDLKTLDEENFEKLKKSILTKGYCFAIHVWKSPEGTYCILDGTQRVRVLTKLAADGYQIGDLPVVLVQADSYHEAIQKLLSGASQYGTPDKQGLYELMHVAGIAIGDLETVELTGIDVEEFNQEYFQDSYEIKPGGEPKKEFLCPHCGKNVY